MRHLLFPALLVLASCPNPTVQPKETGKVETAETAETDETDDTVETAESGDTDETGKVDTAADDADGDGYTETTGDCDDASAAIHPGADDALYDGVDADCAGNDDFDADADGWVPDAWVGVPTDGVAGSGALPGGDCWDDAASVPDEFQVVEGEDTLGNPLSWVQPVAADVHPGATDTWYDGPDQDCAGDDDFDRDLDGFQTDDYPHWGLKGVEYGFDCVDDPDTGVGLDHENPAAIPASLVNPSAAEAWYDGTDQDCDANDCDADGDGYDYPGSLTCASEDCDDSNPSIYADPTVAEIWYDGVDDNCDGNDGDQDGDGFWAADYTERVLAAGGVPLVVPPGAEGDCWDDPADAAEFSALNGMDPLLASEVWPGAPSDLPYDGIDQDCGGESDFDVDADGSDAAGYSRRDGSVGDDCDDANADIRVGATEACNNVDDDCDGIVDGEVQEGTAGSSLWWQDADNDGWGGTAQSMWTCQPPQGFAANNADCDDGAATVNPGADELCNGADDDCDGATDEADAMDASLWFVDADGDGYGDTASGAQACEAPSGHVSDSTDCDDDATEVNPAATEVCDAVATDEDCDGLADDADPMVSATSPWFADLDEDGFGDPGFRVDACLPPTGFVADETDCDDSTAGVNPAATEICDAVATDEDCDGLADDADPTVTGESSWYRDADADGFGNPADPRDACLLPAGYVANVDDCDDSTAGVNPAATEICDAADVDEDCDGQADDLDAGDPSGETAWYPDSDADTWGDTSSAGDLACDPSTAFPVADHTDCDDTRANVRPDGTEVCDAADLDEDCDSLADDLDAGATGQTPWYPDDDHDSYGNAASTGLPLCDPGAWQVGDHTDCDDANANIHPGAAETANGFDDDCDGTVDNGVYFTSCSAIKTAIPTALTGLFTIDPDGPAGSVTPFSVQCEMSLDTGGWTLVAAASNNAYFANSSCYTLCGGSGPTTCNETPYTSATTYGSPTNISTVDHKSRAWSTVPFREFMFQDSTGHWASYSINGSAAASVLAWYPAGLRNYVGNNVEVHPSYTYTPRATNMATSVNSCNTLRVVFNLEDSDTPIGAGCHSSVKGPSWSAVNNDYCYWDDGGVVWADNAFYQTNTSTWQRWYVR